MEHFVVKHYSEDAHPSIKGNGFDGLVIGNNRSEAEDFINWINAVIDKACNTNKSNICIAETKVSVSQWNLDKPECACGGKVILVQEKYRCDCGRVFYKI